MSIVHWLLLIIVIAAVGGAYWYLRRHNGNDPWRNMEDNPAADDASSEGVSLGGDSYILGVRTLSSAEAEQERSGKAPNRAGNGYSDADAEAAWSAFKKEPDTTEPPPAGAPDAPPEELQSAPRPHLRQVSPQPGPAARPEAGSKARTAPRQGQSSRQEPVAPPPEQPSAAARVENIRAPRPTGNEQIFMLHVASRDERHFDGPDIHAALDAEGLKFGPHDFYHRITDANGAIESVYSVANMLKPGTLDPVDQDHLHSPGLTLFLMLPGVIEGG
ncbi:MAG TPA: cell division protein ZipA C-terminal FtsZ-binding domain-containing protein, partial [Salinisphaeraceae bacterium]|nr:cell division protein ZipA C-terminal FtsZ-binding domain-containing protein [Salinisphaeraceae bacterium]